MKYLPKISWLRVVVESPTLDATPVSRPVHIIQIKKKRLIKMKPLLRLYF